MDPRSRCDESRIWTLRSVRFAWQVWSIVHSDVAQHACRVAGVGNRARSVRVAWQAFGKSVSWRVAGCRFAWQARIVHSN